jgi:hypothetical protein
VSSNKFSRRVKVRKNMPICIEIPDIGWRFIPADDWGCAGDPPMFTKCLLHRGGGGWPEVNILCLWSANVQAWTGGFVYRDGYACMATFRFLAVGPLIGWNWNLTGDLPAPQIPHLPYAADPNCPSLQVQIFVHILGDPIMLWVKPSAV